VFFAYKYQMIILSMHFCLWSSIRMWM